MNALEERLILQTVLEVDIVLERIKMHFSPYRRVE